MSKTKTLATLGLLVALALILSYVESLIPTFFAIPGMKLGLTNLVVLVALYLLGERSAVAINLVRILLVGLLFGNGVSIFYSISGGILSLLMMILLKKSNRFSIITVSICGGISHNIGQILAAMVILQTTALGWYLCILWFTGLAAGAIIGILGAIITQRLKLHLASM